MLKPRSTTGNRSRRTFDWAASPYQALEPRNLLAALFPTYIDGQFTLGKGPGAAAPYELADTFKLESKPNATKTIYLDFDGHHSVNNSWGHNIVFPAFDRNGDPTSFNNAELIEIQLQFQNVAEDFLPFNVNVTTRDPGQAALQKTSQSDQRYGIRVVNTQATGGFGDGIGGVAFLNSFDDSIDNPVFTFNKGANNGAITNSHEVGHALGLRHDGLGNKAYHPGTGTGSTSWGPIMGAPFGENLTQWSNGSYANSTNTENDLAIITKPANGFGFRNDDFGNTPATASTLAAGTDVFEWGIIGRSKDVDMFRFETNGAIDLAIKPMGERPNLDIRARIYDASGVLVANSNPANRVDAGFNTELAAGQYFLAVQGIGKQDVYTRYGSMGLYTIEGSIEPMSLEGDVIGESGRIQAVDERWLTVNLDNTYQDPVVIAGPASRNGSDPGNVRVRNVTANSFEIRFDEWEYLNRRHTFETVDYLVVEAGAYTMGDGTIVMAANRGGQTGDWRPYDLGGIFDDGGVPVVFSQIVSDNDSASATTRIRNLNRDGFELKIREEEASQQNHGAESISYLAIGRSRGTSGTLDFEVGITPKAVNHNLHKIEFVNSFTTAPVFLADMQTHAGGDPATVRYQGLNVNRASLFVEEERSADNEIRHAREAVGYMAIEIGDLYGEEIGDGPALLTRPAVNGPSPQSADSLWEDLRVMQSWGETTLPLGEHASDLQHFVSGPQQVPVALDWAVETSPIRYEYWRQTVSRPVSDPASLAGIGAAPFSLDDLFAESDEVLLGMSEMAWQDALGDWEPWL